MKLIIFLFFISIFSSVSVIWPIENNPSTSIIIYLQGTCSSGKSTLIKSIKQKCDLEIVEEDSIMQRSYVAAVAQRFPYKFTCINHAISQNNLYHALREKDILFKKTASNDDCTKATDALTEIQEELNKPQNLCWKQEISQGISVEVIQKLREVIEKNKNVLLDSWYVKENHIAKLFPNAKIIRVLLYCSLPVAYHRLLMRNEEALLQENLLEKRYLRQLIGSFTALYQISEHPINPIQKVYRNELKQIFEDISQKIEDHDLSTYQKPVFTFTEISRFQFLQIKSQFLQPFETYSSELFYISPRKEHDVIIDNSSQDIQKAVDLIKEILFYNLQSTTT